MPLPQLTLPPGTPVFRSRGFSVQQASQFAHPRFQTGHSRARRVWTAGERLVPVSLLLSAAKAAEVFAWSEGALPDGNGRFAARVANDETDDSPLLWYTAEFESPPTFTPRGRSAWVLTATLRLTGDGQVEGPYTGLLAYRARASLGGSVVGTVVPTVRYAATAALLPQTTLRYRATASLQQQIRLAYLASAALLPD